MSVLASGACCSTAVRVGGVDARRSPDGGASVTVLEWLAPVPVPEGRELLERWTGDEGDADLGAVRTAVTGRAGPRGRAPPSAWPGLIRLPPEEGQE